MRIIKRRYFSKKLNDWVSKEYRYGDINNPLAGKRGKVIVNAKGKINKKNFDKFMEEVKDEIKVNFKKGVYGDRELDEVIRANVQDIKDYVNTRAQDKSRLTTSGIRGAKFANTRAANYLLNMGLDLDEAAKEYGVTVDELINDDNWVGNQFKNPSTGVLEAPLIFKYMNSSVI